jgi:hypothetical protein
MEPRPSRAKEVRLKKNTERKKKLVLSKETLADLRHVIGGVLLNQQVDTGWSECEKCTPP